MGLRAGDVRYKVINKVPSCREDGCSGVSSNIYIKTVLLKPTVAWWGRGAGQQRQRQRCCALLCDGGHDHVVGCGAHASSVSDRRMVGCCCTGQRAEASPGAGVSICLITFVRDSIIPASLRRPIVLPAPSHSCHIPCSRCTPFLKTFSKQPLNYQLPLELLL